MLILSRKFDESIIIGDDIVITVIRIKGGMVRLGIEAPADVSIHREEVYRNILRGKQHPSQTRPALRGPARPALRGPAMETCGYCGGSGEVPGPQYDADGRHRPDFPLAVICAFCVGAGRCRDGAKLTPADRA